MRRSTTLPVALLLTGCLAAWADHPIEREIRREEPAQEQPLRPSETDLDWHILNFGGGSPTFIPEKAFTSRPLGEIGLSSGQISAVTDMTAYATPPGCQPRMGRSGRGAFASFSIEEAIASEPVAFVGTVRRIIPGLSTWELFVGRAVYVEVERVLHGDFSPAAGVVAFAMPGGTISLDGTRVCTYPEEGLHQPLVGDRLVVAGIPSHHDPLSFQEVLVLPVLGGEVLPVDSPILGVHAKPMPESRLLPELGQEREQ